MKLRVLFYIAGDSGSLRWAAAFLEQEGIHISPVPCRDVTHLLLPVPSFDAAGAITGGWAPGDVLAALPGDIRVMGGKLNHPLLAAYKKDDLLADETFTALNARITADCAVSLAMEKLAVTPRDAPALVLGWGRIGKCIAPLWRNLGGQVTVAARKEKDRAMAQSLGFDAVEIGKRAPGNCRVVFNTVPEIVLDGGDCPKNCLKIDLASQPGITGDDVLWARGLPGKMAPESTGKLIAETVLRKLKEETP